MDIRAIRNVIVVLFVKASVVIIGVRVVVSMTSDTWIQVGIGFVGGIIMGFSTLWVLEHIYPFKEESNE